MFITKKHLSRRTFLRRTLGATVALPFLDAMAPALSAAPTPSFKFGAIYLRTVFTPIHGIRTKPARTSCSSQ